MKRLGLTLLSVVGWPAVRLSGRADDDGIFATQFLRDGNSVQVPEGYYDPQSQMYLDAKTHTPLFGQKPAQTAAAETATLTDRQLADLLNKGRYVDVTALQKLKEFKTTNGEQWCTLSRLTTLSTTKCCPIVTDTNRDTECDDTPTTKP